MTNFLLTLAGHLGKTLRELTDDLTREELLLWMGKHQIDPIGPVRDDWNAAATRATMINLAHLHGRNKCPDKVDVDDMMPKFGPAKRGRTLSERERWEMWVKAHG